MFVKNKKKRQYTRDKIELVQIQLLSITAPGARLTAARDLFVWLPGSGKLDQLIVTEGKKKKIPSCLLCACADSFGGVAFKR